MSRAPRTKPCPACGTAVWVDTGEVWTKCTSCGRQIHRGEVNDDARLPPPSAILPPSTIAPSTVTTPQTRRTIYLLAIVPLVLALLAGLASWLSKEEPPKVRTPRPPPSAAPSPLSDSSVHG